MSIVFSKDVQGSFPLGPYFTVNIDTDTLIIYRKDVPVWKTFPGLPFISTSTGEDKIVSHDGGVFEITETDSPQTQTQTIEYIQQQDALVLEGYLEGNISYRFSVRPFNEKQITFQVSIASHKRVYVTFSSHPNEDIYGFGEQFSFSTLKGQKVPVFVREQGIGRGDEPITSLLNSSNSVFGQFSGGDHFTTYCSVPQFVSTDNRCVFLENSEYASFDLREPDRIQIRLNASTLTGRIIQGTNLLDVISEYTLYSGRMDLLPDWVSNGAIVGMQGGQEKVRNVIQDLCRHNTPIAAVWLQDWCGKRLQKTPNGTEFKRLWWNWESDDVLYSDWSQLVHDLGSLDSPIRTLVYVNTFLSNVKSKPTFKENLFEIAQERGYLVKDPTSTHEYQTLIISSGANFEAGILDVTNAEARQWFQGVIKRRIWDAGISGMMTDFGEYLPYDSSRVLLSSGVPSEVYHNRYPEDWAKLHHELIHQLGKEDEAVCFYRAGFTRTPGFINLMWAGDQNVSWDQHDGIQSAVTGMLSGGFSGFSVTHSDIGGYTTISAEPVLSMVRSKELLFRWCELSAFTSVFRTHEGIIPELNAQFYDDEETFAHYAFTARLYTSWSPYRKQLLMEAHTKGWPVMRHLVLYYPEDPIVRQITCSQYLLGQFLLVVPVLTSSVTQVKVYFPAEKDTHWRLIWTNNTYAADGTFVHVSAPIKRPAVFIKYPRQDNGLLDDLLRFACDQETQA